jgi:hypothetical protein
MNLNDSGERPLFRMACQYCLICDLGEGEARARRGWSTYHVRMPTKMVVYRFVATDMEKLRINSNGSMPGASNMR